MEAQEPQSNSETFILNDDELEEAKGSTLADLAMTIEELKAEAGWGGSARITPAPAWDAFRHLGLVEIERRWC